MFYEEIPSSRGEVPEREHVSAQRPEVPSRLLERMKTIRAAFPRLDFRQGDHYEGARVESVLGAVVDVRGQELGKPVVVSTDSGIIVEPDREVGTYGMWGCSALIIRHPKGTLFAHLTPTNRLAYMDWDEKKDESNAATVETILKALADAGLDIAECRGTLIGNIGTSSGKFERGRLLTIWNHLGARLQSAGLAHWKTAEVPMDETLVFCTPDKPEKAMVMGRPAKVNGDGTFEVDQKIIDVGWVTFE